MPSVTIDTTSTALIVIDLQKGIAGQQTRPYASNEVIGKAVRLIITFRKVKMPVFLVHVTATPATMLRVESDQTSPRPQPLPTDWSEFVPEIIPEETDIVITKRQWGAFYGTDLELQLRRRKISTLVLCGISTEFGVESTARFAYEYGFQQVFAEDAMGSMSAEGHRAAVSLIFPRMGRVRTTGEILAGLG